jgi:hypothetical protein
MTCTTRMIAPVTDLAIVSGRIYAIAASGMLYCLDRRE